MNKNILLLVVAIAMATMPAAAQRVVTIDQLVDSALATNFAVKGARYDLEAAGQQRREAFTKYFPGVSAAGGWFTASRHIINMEVNPAQVVPEALIPALQQSLPAEALAALGTPVTFSAMKNGLVGGVTAMQPVFAGGQIVNANKLAGVGEQVGQLKLLMAQDQVVLSTEQYCWQLLALQEKLKTVEAVEALLRQLASDATAAVKAGVALRNDLLQVQLRQNEVESNKLQLASGIAVLKLVIAQHCGLSDTAFVCDATFPRQVEHPRMWNHQDALAATPQYQLLEKNVQASSLMVKMERGKNLPTVAVGAGFFYHNLLNNDKPYAMAMVTASVPISGWWGGSHAVKRKKLEQAKAQEQLADNSALLKIRMQQAWDDLLVAYRQLDIAQRSIGQAEENLRIQRDCYKAGTASMSDLLQAQLLFQQAHDRRTEAQAAFQVKRVTYNQATGRRR